MDNESGLYLAGGEEGADAVTWARGNRASEKGKRSGGGVFEKIVSCHAVVRG